MIDVAIQEMRSHKTIPAKEMKRRIRQLRSRANTLAAAAKLLRGNTQVGFADVYGHNGRTDP